jgi:hypothetical protein
MHPERDPIIRRRMGSKELRMVYGGNNHGSTTVNTPTTLVRASEGTFFFGRWLSECHAGGARPLLPHRRRSLHIGPVGRADRNSLHRRARSLHACRRGVCERRRKRPAFCGAGAPRNRAFTSGTEKRAAACSGGAADQKPCCGVRITMSSRRTIARTPRP